MGTLCSLLIIVLELAQLLMMALSILGVTGGIFYCSTFFAELFDGVEGEFVIIIIDYRTVDVVNQLLVVSRHFLLRRNGLVLFVDLSIRGIEWLELCFARLFQL